MSSGFFDNVAVKAKDSVDSESTEEETRKFSNECAGQSMAKSSEVHTVLRYSNLLL